VSLQEEVFITAHEFTSRQKINF